MPRGYRPVGKNADPQSRSERARNAALARTSVDAHINALAALTAEKAPRLTAEQVAKLQTILAPAGR